MDDRKSIIENYVFAYNNFDIDGMLNDMHKLIIFENVSDGKVDMVLNGRGEFKEQAEYSKNLFSNRKQTITRFIHNDEKTEIEVAYHATLAIDLPNGMKKGDELNIKGRSIFTFAGDKIVRLTDIS